ncbi:MAG: Xaa-Pro peptidase family protein [Candidatus Omnitrophica bacterium]|nr:Xaa-Pro peptidase family protein [Candidatus Omnitrophota bacterium]MCF7877223.1 Xaa-Pro peptidase family protein [Candidatus Omnitrophota bacterium]MCF7878070.1 Xaa-Pro peptidase family protein [Candidatus Omnitrophota bacterium]MCF7892751.1 Xaa-Pro peptidase family protein [Candidatus Omnitrophota bacterium]
MKKRIRNLAKIINKKKLDGFLTKNQANIRYLTGLEQPEGWLLCSRNQELIFFTNPISPKPIKDKSYLKTIIVKNSFFKQISLSAKKIKLKKIGFSGNDLSLNCYQKLKDSLNIKKIDLVSGGALIEKLRMRKDKKEIKLIKKAASFSLEAFDYAKEIFSQTMTEKDLSIEIERFLKIKADNQIAFPIIVASGKNSIFTHHNPKETLINNYFLIDLGAMHYGYCADLTRIFFWGKMPPLFQKAYNTIKKAQAAAISRIKEGKKASDIDKAARDVISKNGFGKYFTHGLGHGVGLEVHEPPYLKPGQNEILKEGMVVTIEPGIYYKNQFGIRLENMVIVKAKKAEVIA